MAALFQIMILALLFLNACSTPQVMQRTSENNEDRIEGEEYINLDWQQKTSYLERMASFSSLNEDDLQIVAFSTRANNDRVKQAALRLIAIFKVEDMVTRCIKESKNRSQVVRWRALQCLEQLSPNQDLLPILVKSMRDSEWMVRVVAIRSIRKYPEEKISKRYYKSVLYTLRDEEPNTLEETYKTIFWYEDQRSLRFLLKRSYLAKSEIELIFILRQLAKSSDSQVTTLFRQYQKNSPHGAVRKLCGELLQGR